METASNGSVGTEKADGKDIQCNPSPPPSQPDLSKNPNRVSQQGGPEYTEQFNVMLVQQLMLYLLTERVNLPLKKISRSMALAVVSLALMIPLVYIILQDMSRWGMWAALYGIGVIGLVMVLINLTFNILLLRVAKR